MVLSVEQTDDLARAVFRDHLQEILRDLFSEFLSEQTWDEVDAEIDRMVADAREHGFWSERDVASYVYTAFVLGEGFDQRFRACVEILADTDVPASVRASRLEAFAVQLSDQGER